MGQTKNERIFRTWKASRRTAYLEKGALGSSWMITARIWRMPIREIMAAVKQYKEERGK